MERDEKLLIGKLKALTLKEDLKEVMEEEPLLYIELFESISAFLFKTCGNSNKMSEVITALKLSSSHQYEGSTIHHVQHELGADIKILDADGGERCVEDKSATVRSKDGYKANWNFKVSLAGDLFDSCYDKMRNGFVVLSVRCNGEELNRYSLNGNFMAIYLMKRVMQYGKNAINLGGKRCLKCDHRIIHLQRFEKIFIERAGTSIVRITECFTEEEWIAIFSRLKKKRSNGSKGECCFQDTSC